MVVSIALHLGSIMSTFKSRKVFLGNDNGNYLEATLDLEKGVFEIGNPSGPFLADLRIDDHHNLQLEVRQDEKVILVAKQETQYGKPTDSFTIPLDRLQEALKAGADTIVLRSSRVPKPEPQ